VVDRRGVHTVFVENLKRQLEKPRHRWEDNIKMYLREVKWGEWTGSVCLRLGTGGGLL
jgi:hypothetical protein